MKIKHGAMPPAILAINSSALLVLLPLIGLTGCSTTSKTAAKYPLHTSLDYLTSESSPYYVNDLTPGPFASVRRAFVRVFGGSRDSVDPNRWHQSSVVSIAGQLPYPVPGGAYFRVGDNSPAMSLPINPAGGSYWVQATFNGSSDGKATTAIAQALDDFQQLSLKAALEANHYAAVALKLNQRTNGVEPVKSLEDAMSQTATSLLTARSNLVRLLSQEGVIVLRWGSTAEQKASLVVSDFGSAGVKNTKMASGYAILDGIRFSLLHAGTNFDSEYSEMRKSLGYKSADSVGIATYLLQAKHLQYVQDYQHAKVVSAQADLSKAIKKLSAEKALAAGWLGLLIQLELNLDICASTIQQLSNYGNLGTPAWSAIEVNWKAPLFGQVGANTDGWMTIEAVMTDPKALRHSKKGHCRYK